MSRTTIHAIPLDAGGDHRPSASCPCRPIQARDLLEPARVIFVHSHLPDRRVVEPTAETSFAWADR